MGDKKPYIFPSLLFIIFFILIAITGFFQFRVIQKNIDALLKGEADIIIRHIKREIDVNLEYLNLFDLSPSIITPNFLNVLVYDEEIVEEIYTFLKNASIDEIRRVPFSDMLLLDAKGRVISKKGAVKMDPSYKKRLLSGKEDIIVKMPNDSDKSLLVGTRHSEYFLFFWLNDDELEALRKRHIVKEILAREEKRLNIEGIKVYDEKGNQYASSVTNETHLTQFTVREPLESKFLKGFGIEVILSRNLTNNILKRTTINFIIILVFLVILGALSTYVIFYLERRYTERMKNMEKELAMKERLVSLGRLASGMAHEIRNPLNAVGISVQRLKREFMPKDENKIEYQKFIDIIRDELSRINRIVEDFLFSTRSQAPFLNENLYIIVDEVMIVIGEKAREQGIELLNNVGRDLFAEIQKERFKQALYNMILNGIESMDNGGRIEISAKAAGDMVEIVIQDTGHGIKSGDMEKIFEYYYTSKDKGMGLGLPISYMITKDHGGDIKVSSEEDKGTKFCIIIPIKQGTARN